MSKRNRKSQPVVMPKRESNRIVIKVDSLKVATGHRPHITGTGVHGDKRTKRHRTRGAAKRAAIREQF